MWEGTRPDACSKAQDTGWTMQRVCQSFWNHTLRNMSLVEELRENHYTLSISSLLIKASALPL